MVAGMVTIATVGLSLVARLPDRAPDLSSWNHWRMRAIVDAARPGLDEGPVLVTVESRVDANDERVLADDAALRPREASGRRVALGQRHLEASGVVLHGYGYGDAYYDQFLGQFVDERNARLADAVELHIDLNAVILAAHWWVPTMSRDCSICSRRMWGRNKSSIEASSRRSTLAGPLRRRSALSAGSWMNKRANGAGRMIRPRDPRGRRRQQAAAEAWSWRRKFKDEEIPRLLKSAIRLDPFVIRR
jgi:hypothetical protein